MISLEDSLPKKGKKYLQGQDIIWTQFNDINFYVEDTLQENLYFEILKKLFPDIKLNRIFPLDGKKNVFANAAQNIGDKKKVYLVDLDFDEILGIKNTASNVFYLEKYSIENYLIDFDAIKEIIIEQKPKIKYQEIEAVFDINSFYNECHSLFSDLICYYITIQKHELGIQNVNSDTAQFCNFNTYPATLKTLQINNYHIQTETALRNKNKRLKLTAQLKKFKKYLRTVEQSLKHIPGKYLLNFIKYRIEYLFKLTQMTLESFTFRLAKNYHFRDLLFLKKQISNYIQ